MSKRITLKTEILLEGLKFPKSPRWHDDKLWFVDMETCKVITIDLKGKNKIIIELTGPVSGLGWLPDGRLLIVSVEDCRLLRLDPEGVTEVVDLNKFGTVYLNDMVVDKKGHAYIGNFGFDYFHEKPFAPTKLILVTPDGDAKIVAEDMTFPNGAVITPDDQTLIIAETFAARLTAFDIIEDGSLSGR